MQQIVSVCEIKKRVEALGGSLRELALEAGVNVSTAYRAAEPDADPKLSVVNRLLAKLEEREAALREKLAGHQLELLQGRGT